MKKIAIVMVCTFVFLVVPMRMSNSSGLNLTEKEKLELNKRIKKNHIENLIEKEFDLFYQNLDSINAKEYVREFFNMILCDAIESKSLPSISIAQASLETGYGRYNKLKNNLFGIKGVGIITKTKEYYKGRFITISANFQYFPTLKSAFDGHYQILRRYGVSGNKYENWIDRIVACGYATDPNYDKKLHKIIETYQLNRLDKIQEYTKILSKIDIEESNFVPNFSYNKIWL